MIEITIKFYKKDDGKIFSVISMQKPILILCSLRCHGDMYDEGDIDRWENDGGRSLNFR